MRHLGMALVLLFAAGCSYDSLDKPIRLYPERHVEVAGRTPNGGLYQTVVQEGGELFLFGDVRYVATRGERLGLKVNDVGLVTATIGGDEMEGGDLPPGVDYVAWAGAERRAGTTTGWVPQFTLNVSIERPNLIELLIDGLIGNDDEGEENDRDSSDRGDRYEHLERHARDEPSRRRTRD